MNKLGEYYYVIERGHPRANKDGIVYYHILQAEKKLGRFLEKEEVVHHIDGDKLNNELDNLLVFSNRSEHSKFHKINLSIEELIQCPNGSYMTPLNINKICPICGKEKTSQAKICEKCKRIQERKVKERPTKEALKNLLIENNGNFVKVGKQFEVSDNAIRKWCQQVGLSTHSIAYKNNNGEVGAFVPRIPINWQEVISLWEQGCLLSEISKITGHDAHYISEYLCNNNITTTQIIHERAHKKRSPACLCKNAKGEIVKTFEHIIDAYEWLNKPRDSHISEVCKGKRKTAYGYYWEYI